MDRNLLIDSYNVACNAIATEFINKHYGEPHEPPLTLGKDGDYDWVSDDIGGVLCCADEFFSFSDVLTDIKEDAPAGEIFAYNAYCLRIDTLGLPMHLNYRSWLHGAPRYSEEFLQKTEQLKAELDELRQEQPNC